MLLTVWGVATPAPGRQGRPDADDGVQKFTSYWSSEPDDRCDPMWPGGSGASLNFEGVGRISHLGRITLSGFHRLQLRGVTVAPSEAFVT
ncbi:MAG: hypothetical protein WCA29_11085 [Jiangellales bacterium]